MGGPGFLDSIHSEGRGVSNFFEECLYLDGISGSLGGKKFECISKDLDVVKESKHRPSCCDYFLTGLKILGIITLAPFCIAMAGRFFCRLGHNYSVQKDSTQSTKVAETGQQALKPPAAANSNVPKQPVSVAPPQTVDKPAPKANPGTVRELMKEGRLVELKKAYESLSLEDKIDVCKFLENDQFNILFIKAEAIYEGNVIVDAIIQLHNSDIKHLFHIFMGNLKAFLDCNEGKFSWPSVALFLDKKAAFEDAIQYYPAKELINTFGYCHSVSEVNRRVSTSELSPANFKNLYMNMHIDSRKGLHAIACPAAIRVMAEYEGDENYRILVKSVLANLDLKDREKKILAAYLPSNRFYDPFAPSCNLNKAIIFREELNTLPPMESNQIKDLLSDSEKFIFDLPVDRLEGALKLREGQNIDLLLQKIATYRPSWIFEILPLIPHESPVEEKTMNIILERIKTIPDGFLLIATICAQRIVKNPVNENAFNSVRKLTDLSTIARSPERQKITENINGLITYLVQRWNLKPEDRKINAQYLVNEYKRSNRVN